MTKEEIVVGEDVTSDQCNELLFLLNEHRLAIAKNIDKLGCSTQMEMDIVLKSGSVPVCSKPYSTSHDQREFMKKTFCAWRRKGIVQDTNAEYASPVLLAKTKNGNYRVVTDYRKVNDQTVRIHYPLPNLDEFLVVLAGATMFAVIDLSRGYLQIPLKKEARHITAYVTPDETGEFTRATFGLTNAPFYFSKAMELALGPLRNKILVFYLDDILIVAKDWNELIDRIRQTLQALIKAGFTLNLTKCSFGVKYVEYLSLLLEVNGIQPGP